MSKEADTLNYVDRLRAEHLRLEQLIRQTMVMFSGCEAADATDWGSPVVTRLVTIRDELAHHFRYSEHVGCLEEAVARCPQLSVAIVRVASHHSELLEPLNELIDRCRSAARPTPTQARALAQEFRQVASELRLHGALENRIAQQGFSVSLQADDRAEQSPADSMRLI